MAREMFRAPEGVLISSALYTPKAAAPGARETYYAKVKYSGDQANEIKRIVAKELAEFKKELGGKPVNSPIKTDIDEEGEEHVILSFKRNGQWEAPTIVHNREKLDEVMFGKGTKIEVLYSFNRYKGTVNNSLQLNIEAANITELHEYVPVSRSMQSQLPDDWIGGLNSKSNDNSLDIDFDSL